MNIKKEYTNGEVTIIWQPGLCQHAGICTKTLPNVYHPKEKPWITAEKCNDGRIDRSNQEMPVGSIKLQNE